LVDLAVRMAVDDPGEDVGQVRERIDVVPSFNLRVSIREAMFGAAVRSCEQRIFPVECDQTDGRSTALLSSSMRPSSMKRVSPSQRERA
jgi:hypothetical protein